MAESNKACVDGMIDDRAQLGMADCVVEKILVHGRTATQYLYLANLDRA